LCESVLQQGQGKIGPTNTMNQKEGKWGFKFGQFIKGAIVPKYMMLDTTNSVKEETHTEFIQMLAKMGEELGMKKFVQPRDVKISCPPLKTVRELFLNL
jgi:hypothetical protein